MHFAFEAAVSFILRVAYFLGLYFHIRITVKGERKENVTIRELLESIGGRICFGGTSCSVC